MKKNNQRSEFKFFDPITPDLIPDIDLYMDQVLTLLSEKLYLQNSGNSEKMLTKTMINNYSKNKLIPPSKNKKYTRRHILLLILIYHMKQSLSISDIEVVTKSLFDDDDVDFAVVYDAFTKKQESIMNDLDDGLSETIKMTSPGGTIRDKSQTIELILELVLEANLRKQLAERLIETIRQEGGL